MTLPAVVISLLLGQSPAQPAQPAVAPGCGEASEEAADALRRTANSRRDPAARKHALEQLACMYDSEHLDRPRDADPVLRELIAMSPDDLTPMLRLAKLQEKQELFDAAESTLLAARQQKPDDIAPYRELAQYFSRRAAALSAAKERDERGSHPDEADKPDKDGVYPLGGSIQPPEQISAGSVRLPIEVTAAGITGTVAMEVIVDETGRVTDAKILRSVPGLDATALATVRTWRFTPATLNGRPVKVRLPVAVRVGGGSPRTTNHTLQTISQAPA